MERRKEAECLRKKRKIKVTKKITMFILWKNQCCSKFLVNEENCRGDFVRREFDNLWLVVILVIHIKVGPIF